MRTMPNLKKHQSLARVSIFVTMVALIAAMIGCAGGDGDSGDGSYTLIVDFTTGGTVAVDDVPIPGKAILTYHAGTVVTLNATPSAGYWFVVWTGDVDTIADADAAATTITMDDNYSVTAKFIAEYTEYTLTIDSTDGGQVISPPEGMSGFEAGDVVDLVAEPAEGYKFLNWTGDTETVANTTAASTTITMNDNYSITANFEEEGDFVPAAINYCDFYGFPDRFFEEASLTRDQVIKVVGAQYLSLKKMHNGISPYEFCRVEYEPEAYGVTSPTGFKLGNYAFPSLNSGHHRWEVMAHEQGHNFFGGTSWFYYRMAAPYPFLQESLAVLSAFYTYHDILEHAVAYDIDDDSIDSLVFDFTNGRTYQESMYNKYTSEGKNFNLGSSTDILTSQALDFKMITYGEQYGWRNFENLTKAFENELDRQFSFLDDGASAVEQSTYIVAALNVAFQRDFTQEFIELEFPIDSSLLQEFTAVLEQYIY